MVVFVRERWCREVGIRREGVGKNGGGLWGVVMGGWERGHLSKAALS